MVELVQKLMWTEGGLLPVSYRVEPIARSTDPQTSHDAAAGVAPTLNLKQQECLKSFIGEMTANEVAFEASLNFVGMAETYRKRVHELQRKGLIVACGSRLCRITGTSATAFKVKDR